MEEKKRAWKIPRVQTLTSPGPTAESVQNPGVHTFPRSGGKVVQHPAQFTQLHSNIRPKNTKPSSNPEQLAASWNCQLMSRLPAGVRRKRRACALYGAVLGAHPGNRGPASRTSTLPISLTGAGEDDELKIEVATHNLSLAHSTAVWIRRSVKSK